MRMQIYYLIGTEQVVDNEAELIAIQKSKYLGRYVSVMVFNMVLLK